MGGGGSEVRGRCEDSHNSVGQVAKLRRERLQSANHVNVELSNECGLTKACVIPGPAQPPLRSQPKK